MNASLSSVMTALMTAVLFMYASCTSASPGAFEGEDEPSQVKEMKMPVGPTMTHGMLKDALSGTRHPVVVFLHLPMVLRDQVFFAIVTKDEVEQQLGKSGEAKNEHSKGRILTTSGVGMVPCLLLALLEPDAGHKVHPWNDDVEWQSRPTWCQPWWYTACVAALLNNDSRAWEQGAAPPLQQVQLPVFDWADDRANMRHAYVPPKVPWCPWVSSGISAEWVFTQTQTLEWQACSEGSGSGSDNKTNSQQR